MENPIDLDDTTRCPRGDHCEYCGTPTELDVAPITTPIGVLCLTSCAACTKAKRLPALSWPAAAHRVIAHCEHLDCDLEEMAAAIAAQQGDAR